MAEKKVSAPLFEAKGTIRIIDKDGNVKSELEITDVQFPEQEKPPVEVDENANQ
jgi:hypothetical protein